MLCPHHTDVESSVTKGHLFGEVYNLQERSSWALAKLTHSRCLSVILLEPLIFWSPTPLTLFRLKLRLAGNAHTMLLFKPTPPAEPYARPNPTLEEL